MSLLGSELCEVYGNSFVEEISQTRKSKKQREKKKSKKNTNEDTVGDALLNNFSKEVDNLVEGFANFEKKPEPTVEIVQTENFDEESDSEPEEEREYAVKRRKSKPVKSKSKPVVRERVQCEMDDMNDKINDLDVKLNLLLEKLNSREEVKETNKPEEKNEMTNIYDLILFVIFGVFFLLLLESISKVVVKNATKLNNVNPLVFNN